MSTKKMYFPVIICIVIVAALVFGALFGLERAVSRSDAATAKLSEMTTLSNDIMQVNDKLIKLIRVYIINGDETAFNTYNTILDDPASFNDKLDRMIEIGLNNEETASVDKILGYLDILAEIEGKAIDAKDAGNDALASTTLFGNDYISTDSKLSVETENLINLIKTRFSEVNKSSENEVRLFLGITVCLIVSMIAITALIINSSIKKSFWYESLLDSLPLPISVTDMNMNWTFINKPVEQMLNVKRPQVLGKHCSNWGAGICKTDNCGITCLRSGKTVTFFEQLGMDFRVDISYLNNAKGKKIGHIEVVQDISEMMKAHKKQSELVKEVADVASTFASGSHQIANGSNILAQGSTQQAAAIEELSASITAMSEKTKANAEKATRAATLADSIKQNAENGSRQMNEMMTATKEINEASHDIGKVIKVIDDIAFQTNILALNAAVEAARAGQHGKGFAVVADEVRNLAAKSAEAAKDTGSLIANSMEKAEFGARVAGETAASLAQIVEGINESTLIVTEIAESSSEQSSSIAEITRGIDQVAQVVHQNSATAEESAAASAEISEQAKLLEKLVNNDSE